MQFFYNCDTCNLRGHTADAANMEVVKRALRVVPVCGCKCSVTSWVIVAGQSLATMHFRCGVTARRAEREVQKRIQRLVQTAADEGSVRHAMLTTPMFMQADGKTYRGITASQVIVEISRVAAEYQTIPVNVRIGVENDPARQVVFAANRVCSLTVRKLLQ